VEFIFTGQRLADAANKKFNTNLESTFGYETLYAQQDMISVSWINFMNFVQ
jgi:hypothetical protein